MRYATKPTRREMIFGGIYLFLYMAVLPYLFGLVFALLGIPVSAGELNFLFFCTNFLAVLVIFRKYLFQSAKDALDVPFATFRYALLGYFGNNILTNLVTVFCIRVYPAFLNVNDANISAIMVDDFTLMAVGAIFLAPFAEEVLFRGLVFRGLFDKHPLLAYGLSMTLFAMVHISGYIGKFDPLLLALCFLQYLPAGYCLCFAYHRSGTILAPILMHMLANIAAVYSMR